MHMSCHWSDWTFSPWQCCVSSMGRCHTDFMVVCGPVRGLLGAHIKVNDDTEIWYWVSVKFKTIYFFQFEHIEAWTIWLKFCRQHFRMCFLLLTLSVFMKFCWSFYLWVQLDHSFRQHHIRSMSYVVLVQAMGCHPTGWGTIVLVIKVATWGLSQYKVVILSV